MMEAQHLGPSLQKPERVFRNLGESRSDTVPVSLVRASNCSCDNIVALLI